MTTNTPQPHFFCLQSRLGLKYPPSGSTELNIGVENGGVEILSPDFTFEFDHLNISKLLAFSPDDVITGHYVKDVIDTYRSQATFINQQLKPDQIQVALGGDHSVSYASLASVLERFHSENVGLIMFDSHADLNLLSTSPSGNIHGMWLRMLINDFDHDHARAVNTQPMNPHNILLVGNLLLDPEEVRFTTDKRIPIYNYQAIQQGEVKSTLKDFIAKYQHIHLSFDIDVFQQHLAPATGTSNPDGLTIEQVFPLLKVFQQAKSLSIDLVEVNPQKPGAEQTLELARDVLRVLLRKQLNYRLER